MFNVKRRGFTLIELLVVISIISFLSSVVMSVVNDARVKARDARRLQDMEQIRIALELYRVDNGRYPQPHAGCGYNNNCYAFSNEPTWNDLTSALSNYISPLPVDPVNTNDCFPWDDNCHVYSYGNVVNGGWGGYQDQYDLTSQFENDNHALRCEINGYTWRWDNRPWCGVYSDQIYEASLSTN